MPASLVPCLEALGVWVVVGLTAWTLFMKHRFTPSDEAKRAVRKVSTLN